MSDLIDNNCVLLNLNDLYLEYLSSIDLFYDLLDNPARLLSFIKNSESKTYVSASSCLWLMIMLDMDPVSEVSNLLLDLKTNIANLSLKEFLSDFTINATKGRKVKFKAAEGRKFYDVNLVAYRALVFLSNIKENPELSLNIFTGSIYCNDDAFVPLLASNTALTVCENLCDDTVAHALSLNIILDVKSFMKRFMGLVMNHLEVFDSRDRALNQLQKVQSRFEYIICESAHVPDIKELQLPVELYANDNEELRMCYDKVKIAKQQHDQTTLLLRQVEADLTLGFACLRCLLCSLSLCIYKIFGSQLIKTVPRNLFSQSSGDMRAANPHHTALSAVTEGIIESLLDLPWTDLVTFSLLEEQVIRRGRLQSTSCSASRPLLTLCSQLSCKIQRLPELSTIATHALADLISERRFFVPTVLYQDPPPFDRNRSAALTLAQLLEWGTTGWDTLPAESPLGDVFAFAPTPSGSELRPPYLLSTLPNARWHIALVLSVLRSNPSCQNMIRQLHWSMTERQEGREGSGGSEERGFYSSMLGLSDATDSVTCRPPTALLLSLCSPLWHGAESGSLGSDKQSREARLRNIANMLSSSLYDADTGDESNTAAPGPRLDVGARADEKNLTYLRAVCSR